MTFQKINPTTVALKSGSGVLSASADGTLKVGDYLIEGPGEYDVAGIGLHVFDDYAFATSEAIHVGIVWNNAAKIVAGDDAAIDILVCLIDSVDAITSLMQVNDPRVIAFIDESVASQVALRDGLTVDAQSPYKITQPALPVDTRAAILLT